MSLIEQLLRSKRSGVGLSVEDLVEEWDSTGWKERHPLGPVHTCIVCKCCGETVVDDLKGFGHLENRDFVTARILPHLRTHDPLLNLT